MNGKIPPHSTETEKTILGACLLEQDALLDILELVKAEDFYSEAHKEIFTAIEELYRKNEPVDSLMLAEELKKRKSLEAVGGRTYIMSLADEVPTTANVKQYAQIISEKSVLRHLIKIAANITEQSFDEKSESQEVLDKAEQDILEIAQGRQKKDYVSLQDTFITNLETFDRLSKNEGALTGLTTGFIDLDQQTAGLQKSNLIVVAARPRMGKTAFALNIAQHVAVRENKVVAMFSLEMSKDQLLARMICSESLIDSQKLRAGKLDDNDWEKLAMGAVVMSESKIFIDDTASISLGEMRSKCRKLKVEHGLDLIVIDYLQLMSGSGRTNSREQEISEISRGLKALAREMDAPVVALSQLSRAPELRADKRPILSDLRESGAIEQDADVVMFLYRDEYYNKDTEFKNVAEVILAKQRNGPTGTVKLIWSGQYTKFRDALKRD